MHRPLESASQYAVTTPWSSTQFSDIPLNIRAVVAKSQAEVALNSSSIRTVQAESTILLGVLEQEKERSRLRRHDNRIRHVGSRRFNRFKDICILWGIF